jgi:hypothetical protein
MAWRALRREGANAEGSRASMLDRRIAAEVIKSQGEYFAFYSLRGYDCAAGENGCQGGRNNLPLIYADGR